MQVLKSNEELQETIKTTVNKLVDFVKPTYGPSNNTIIMKINGGVQAVDDGVSIARGFSLPQHDENAIVDLIRETASKTSNRVKDGTTTSLLLLQGIVNSIDDSFEDIEGIKKAGEEAKEQLRKNSKQINTLEELKTVAKIAYNNNSISESIAQVVYEVGKDGIVTVEEGDGLDVEYKIVEGMQFNSGYLSPHMVTDYGRLEAVSENASILVTDQKINDYQNIFKLLNQLSAGGKKELVIIADEMDDATLSLLTVNKLKGNFTTIVMLANEHGARKKEFFSDVCAVTGAQLISHDFGLKLNDIKLEHLGSADKVIATNNDTKIIGGKTDIIKMTERANYYEKSIENSDNSIETARLKKNFANLSGGIGVIKVGANTIQEVITMIPKIENVVNSVMSAYKSGVVKGSGLALKDIKTSSKVLNKALKNPHEVISENCGEAPITGKDALNYVTKEKGDYITVGVIDATEVLTVAIDSAISVAGTLIKSKGMMYEVE